MVLFVNVNKCVAVLQCTNVLLFVNLQPYRLKTTGWLNMIRDLMADLPDVTVEEVG